MTVAAGVLAGCVVAAAVCGLLVGALLMLVWQSRSSAGRGRAGEVSAHARAFRESTSSLSSLGKQLSPKHGDARGQSMRHASVSLGHETASTLLESPLQRVVHMLRAMEQDAALTDWAPELESAAHVLASHTLHELWLPSVAQDGHKIDELMTADEEPATRGELVQVAETLEYHLPSHWELSLIHI